jgi:hypothetical protein
MITETEARERYSLCRQEILHRARGEKNDLYIDVVFTDAGNIMMMYADAGKRHNLHQKNLFFFGVDCHILAQLDDIDQSFEDAIKEFRLTSISESFIVTDITDLDNWI